MASRLKCSKGWRTINDGRSPSESRTCCCTRRLATKEGFLNAIGYLIRRLDENTGPQNFLRHAYRLKPDSHEFAQLASDFRKSLELASTVSNRPRRSADRDQPPAQPAAAANWSELVNEPDTDWAVPAHSQWASEVLDRWSKRCDDSAAVVRLSIGSEPIECSSEELRESFDPSRPGVVACRYQVATLDQVKQAVSLASKDVSGWRQTSAPHRHALLREVAQKLRQRRGDLIGAMVADAGKTVAEADPEVSEAIDFCEFYPLAAVDWERVGNHHDHTAWRGGRDHSLEFSAGDSLRRRCCGTCRRQQRHLEARVENGFARFHALRSFLGCRHSS